MKYNEVFNDPLAANIRITNVLFRINKDAHFRCVNCANCCRSNTAPLKSNEIKRYKKMGYKDFAIPDTKGKSWSGWVIKKVNGKCFFLGDDDSCKVYKDRPLICKTYPFAIRNYLPDKKIVVITYMIEGARDKNFVCDGFHKGAPTIDMLRPFVKPLRDEWEYNMRNARKLKKQKNSVFV